jgi:hypothetical protein
MTCPGMRLRQAMDATAHVAEHVPHERRVPPG